MNYRKMRISAFLRFNAPEQLKEKASALEVKAKVWEERARIVRDASKDLNGGSEV